MLKKTSLIFLIFHFYLLAYSNFEVSSKENDIEIDFFITNISSNTLDHLISIDLVDNDSLIVKNILSEQIPKIRINETLIYTLNKSDLSNNHTLSGINKFKFIIDTNIFIHDFNLGINKNELIINEILFNNSDDISEFIEIKNISIFTLDLIGLLIQDKSYIDKDKYSEIKESIVIHPGEFALISMGDKNSNYYNFSDNENKLNYELSPKISLNNSDDIIRISNKNGLTIDSVYYSESMHSKFILDNKNISLERGLNGKFSSSVNRIGSTPLETNSFYKVNTKSNLRSDKKIFDPKSEIIKIDYKIPFPQAIINLSVYNEEGRLIKRMASSMLSSSNGTFYWDGTDENRIFTESGLYILFLEANELNGIKNVRNKILVATVNKE